MSPTDQHHGEHPDLLDLLRGELGNAEAAAAGHHLQACGECRDELAGSVVGHALLTRAARTLGAEPGPSSVDPAALPALPPAAELEARWPEASGRRPRRALRVAAVAASLVLAAGLGAAVQSWRADDAARVPVADREATLEAVTGAGTGTVSMHEADGQTSMTISTHDLPVPRAGQFYYAWLLDPATNKMLPLGQVGPGGSASFELSDTLLAAYSAVDVSLEDDDGDPQHSPTSVLRARYA